MIWYSELSHFASSQPPICAFVNPLLTEASIVLSVSHSTAITTTMRPNRRHHGFIQVVGVHLAPLSRRKCSTTTIFRAFAYVNRVRAKTRRPEKEPAGKRLFNEISCHGSPISLPLCGRFVLPEPLFFGAHLSFVLCVLFGEPRLCKNGEMLGTVKCGGWTKLSDLVTQLLFHLLHHKLNRHNQHQTPIRTSTLYTHICSVI